MGVPVVGAQGSAIWRVSGAWMRTKSQVICYHGHIATGVSLVHVEDRAIGESMLCSIGSAVAHRTPAVYASWKARYQQLVRIRVRVEASLARPLRSECSGIRLRTVIDLSALASRAGALSS
jgi:hypothetical protein